MRNAPASEPDAMDHDSFLDIVANIVGILIILVMVVSVRARDAPPLLIGAGAPRVDLATPRNTALALEHDIHEIAADAQELQNVDASRRRERSYLAALVATVEKAIAERRGTLDDAAREQFDLRRRLADQQARLEKIEREQTAIDASKGPAHKVQNYPTPVGKTVFGRETHFQLRGRLIAHLPVEALVEEAKAEARQKVWKLDSLPETTEIVGPREGFRMRYTLEKVEIPLEMRLETGRGGYLIRSKRWELIPTGSRLGEPLDKALAPGSRFRQIIRRLDPKQVTITLWVYPDSFAEFRRLKEELFRLGFATAGRPLPHGIPIGGSPRGTRSSAE